jgi:AmiR/NasT family two-component response regulator
MKSEPNAPPVVLVITGADKVIVDRLDARRIHGVIRKPFDPEEVGSVVAACTDIRARNALDTMMLATMAGANLFAWLSSQKW